MYKFFVGNNITGFEDNGLQRPISRVTLQVDDENVLTAGDDTGMELLADCPHASQERLAGKQLDNTPSPAERA